jgi:teichuronic acid exporter
MKSKSLGDKIREGAKWSYFGQIYMTAGHFVAGVILARLLGPAEFGVFIAVAAYTSLVLIAVQFGMPQAIIQAKELEDVQVNAAFWSILLLGLMFSLGLFGIAEWLSGFYDGAQFRNVMYAMCGIFVITPYTSVGLALMRRTMRFREVAIINVTTFTVTTPIAIVAAMLGFGVFSLVVGALVGMLVNLIMLHRLLAWRPSFPSLLPVRSLLRYSAFTTVNNTLSAAIDRVDSMLVGGLLGAAQLGLYNRSFSLARIPSDQFAESVGPLVLGSLSRLQDDVEWSRKLFFKAVSAITLLTMPFLVFLFVAGPRFIEMLYGSEWAGAALPLRAMLVGAIFLTVTSTLRAFINAQGLVRQAAPVFLLTLAATVFIVLILSNWGLFAIAIGISAREALVFVLFVAVLRNSRISLRWLEVIYAVIPALVSGAAGLVAGGLALDCLDQAVGLGEGLEDLLWLGVVTFGSYTITGILLMTFWLSHEALQNTRDLLHGAFKSMYRRAIRN